tara:strand:- start:1499 stop:1777 length:279 start_codon:yes stop_codon:yes gene_type:complete
MDNPYKRQIPTELLPQAQAIWKREDETNALRNKLHSAAITIDSLVEVAELLCNMIGPRGVVGGASADLEEVKLVARRVIGRATQVDKRTGKG